MIDYFSYFIKQNYVVTHECKNNEKLYMKRESPESCIQQTKFVSLHITSSKKQSITLFKTSPLKIVKVDLKGCVY